MDMKVYYQRIREQEQSLPPNPIVVSLETPDGGTAGVKTETTVLLAAKLIVEGRARAADGAETKAFEQEKLEAKRIADHLQASGRMQITVVSESDLRTLKSAKQLAKQ
jgi:hypothetical protein